MKPIEIIADYRENQSSVWEYLSADELEKVPGIGPKTAAAIRDLVSPEINRRLSGH
jgi:DNA uptake protein ComE-like DNA-binding protein